MIFFQRHLTILIKLTLLSLCILLIPSQSYGMDVELQWEANPEPLTGYKLYYKVGENSAPPYDGTGLNEGASPILTGKVTTYTVTDLSPDKTYHFALTAYNEDGDSGYSTIVTVSPDPIPIIDNISIN